MSGQPRRDFPTRWNAVELQESFRIEDAEGCPVAYVNFAGDPERCGVAGRMSRYEARRIAVGIAALPELRKAVRD